MQTINLMPVNATGTLSPALPSMAKAFDQSTAVAIKELGLKEIDVLVFDFPQDTIKELGIGGRTFNIQTPIFYAIFANRNIIISFALHILAG